LFIIPGFIAMLALSIVYATAGSITWVSGLFAGLQAAVVVLVVQAFIRIARRSLTTPLLRVIAGLSFVAIFLFNVPFPIIIVAAGFMGWLLKRGSPDAHEVRARMDGRQPLLGDEDGLRPGAARSAFRAAAVCAVLWALPIVILVLTVGTTSIFTQQAFLFSKAAVVTFGGAYAVLGYVAQQAVDRYGWITSQDMATGLGLAETTPGPLIMVVQFVGFLAAYNNPGDLPPVLAGVLGSLITVWVTFVPCFLFIFLGAPFAERLRGNMSIAHALSAIGAAVAGVVLDLALWFALNTLFASVDEVSWGPVTLGIPDSGSLQWSAVAIGVVAAILIFRLRMSTLRVLGVCALLGLVAAVAGSGA
jgi:chromate transporter